MKPKVIYIHTIILIEYTLLNSNDSTLLKPVALQVNNCFAASKFENASSHNSHKLATNSTFVSFVLHYFNDTDKSNYYEDYLKLDDWMIAKALLMHSAQNIQKRMAFITSIHNDVHYVRRIIDKLNERQQGIEITHLIVDCHCSSSIYVTLNTIFTSVISTTVLFLPGMAAQRLLDMAQEFTVFKRSWFVLASNHPLYFTTSKIELLYLTEIVSQAIHYENESCVMESTKKSDQWTINMDEHSDDTEILKVATVFDRPFMIESKPIRQNSNSIECVKSTIVCKVPLNSTSWFKTCCGGLALEIFQKVAEDIGLKFDLYIVEDGKYGGIDLNGSWTGIINEVMTGKADIGVQAITVNEVRLNAVDFTEHFMESSFGITLNIATETSLLNWKFANSIEEEMFGCFIGINVLALLTIFICENIIRKLDQKDYYSISEAFSYTCGVAFQKDIGGSIPTVWAARLVVIVQGLGVTIYLTSYTANLTAVNVLNAGRENFHGLKDEKITTPTSKFTLGVRKGANTELYFKYNSLKKHREVYSKLKLITGSSSGMEDVYLGSIDAYIDDYIYSLYKLMTVEKYCSSLIVHKDEDYQNSVAFAVKKHSKLTKTLSSSILKLKETQTLDRLVAKWYNLKKCNEMTTKAQAFPWEYAFSLVLLLLISVIICVLILFGEILYWKKKKETFKEILP